MEEQREGGRREMERRGREGARQLKALSSDVLTDLLLVFHQAQKQQPKPNFCKISINNKKLF